MTIPGPECHHEDPGFGALGIIQLGTIIFGAAVLAAIPALLLAHLFGFPADRCSDTVTALGFLGGACWGYRNLILDNPARPWFALGRGPQGHLRTLFLASGVMTLITVALMVIKLLCAHCWPHALDAPCPMAGHNVPYILVGAPILEEMVFRGILLQGLARRYGFLSANIMASVLFGLVHVHPVSMACTTVIGLMLGLLWQRTRSLVPCIGVHFYNNFLALTLTWWPAWFWLALAPVVILALAGLFWNPRPLFRGAA
jgi:membrane protease YdiL (CAAX protease family)